MLGAPAGAVRVIKELEVGDAVLLVESNRPSSPIPALCLVRTYVNTPLPDLSKALWGSAHYPFIFFFKTEEISLTWGEFIEHVGYSPAYNPRGTFNPIRNEKLEAYGGPAGYIAFLQKHYSMKPDIPYSISSERIIREKPNEEEEYYAQVEDEMADLVRQASASPPKLKAGSSKIAKQSLSHPRDEAFQRDVRRIYGARCAVCGISLTSPRGYFEVQSAHIYPKAHDGADDLRNGICLCRMHHWALDAGWMSLDDDLVILVRKDIPDTKEYDFIRQYEGKMIAKPMREELSPHPLFLQAHRQLNGFE